MANVPIGGRRCLFCNSDYKLTREHTIPDWTQQFVDSCAGPGTHERTILRVGQEPASKSWRGRPATSTVRLVCEGCNTGWMSRLESEAKPWLRPMIVGNGRTYHDRGQEIVASWAVNSPPVT